MTVEGAVADLIGLVADRMLQDEDRIVADMDEAVFDLVPELRADAVLAAETSASDRANLRRFLMVARHADDPPPPDVPPEALDVARTLVRRGIELDAVFQGYRAGQNVAWQAWMECATAVVPPGPQFMAVLEGSLALLFKYVDDVLSRVIAEAQREREEILGGAHTGRVSTARLILEDAPLDSASASSRLGYELSRQHTCLVLWAETPVAQGALESTAHLLSRAVGARRPFLMAAGTSTLWAWVGSHDHPSVMAFREALTQAPDEVRAAVGPTEAGVRGFRRSHEGALVVHRLLLGQPTGDRLAAYADLEVTALAAGDEPRAAEFVVATLGRLAHDDESAARLRETLRVYLDEGDNAPRAAARLHTHRNTVLQRVARATDLLGYGVGERRLALSLALELAHRLGPRVLVSG